MSRVQTVAVWIVAIVVFVGMAECSHRLGISRATQGDIAAVQRQIEERCR